MRLLITAGPTREPIDDVRYISNRSSGRMGIALTEAAHDAGHEVTLLLGPVLVHAGLAERCRLVRFETCAELERLLAQHMPDNDALIMAAAVADYRPKAPAEGKLERKGDMAIQLEPTPDLVAQTAAVRRADQIVVAFALEEAERLEQRAATKLQRKGVDAIVANPLNTMDATQIDARLIYADGRSVTPGRATKPRFAAWLIARVAELVESPQR